MDELIIRFLQGGASPLEEEQLRAWRQSSSLNEARYREVARIWGLTALAEPLLRSRQPSAEEVIHRGNVAQAARGIEARGGARGRQRIRSWAVWGLTAAALVTLGFVAAEVKSRAGTGALAFGAGEFSTGARDMATVELVDGTIVRLAPESRLRVEAGAEKREVWLEGRAFFGVARREGQPFVVRTRLGEAVVLGTRFEVGVRRNRLRVVVVEGRVALSAGAEKVDVGAGEMSVAEAGVGPSLVKVEDVYSMLDWMGRTLVFQETPLAQVATEVERRYDVRIDLLDPSLAGRTVTAWFADESFEEVVTVVCRVIAAECSIGDGRATIAPKGDLRANS
ncbi:MAG: FecR domain-containing protein [Gemmatimonadetes bacterium]|nr:FecR domain-containing protein [Gemmatimonadota bacterium]